MPILAFGLNHRTAGIDLRGRAAILPAELNQTLKSLVDSQPFIRGAMVLSTCNRTEVHCTVACTHAASPEAAVCNWLAQYRNLALSELEGRTYAYVGAQAIRHIMSVAAGLDSQVLGEPEIFGQYKSAYGAAQGANTLDPELELLATTVIQTGKRVRTDTELGRHSVSVSQLTVVLAKQIFSDVSQAKALLLGAGQTIRLASQHLQSAGIQTIDVANRTVANAVKIAESVGGKAIPLTEIGNCLHHYDLVISSTNSATPIVSKEVVAEACQHRRQRPIFIADLAVPRDIDPLVGEIADAHVYNIDDLSSIAHVNLSLRQDAVGAANDIITEGVDSYETAIRARRVSDTVTRYRENLEMIRDQEFQAALTRLKAGEDPQSIIESMSYTLTNKLAHHPTVALRKASISDDGELLQHLMLAYEIG